MSQSNWWSSSSRLCMCITCRQPQKMRTVIGQMARKSIILSSHFALHSTPSLLLLQTLRTPLKKKRQICGSKPNNRGEERRHKGVWAWCRQLSVLLESDQTGLAWLLHYILAQSKIVWPGTALPLGAQSFTTHWLYCTQGKPARLQITVHYMRQVLHCMCMCVCL